MTTVAVLGLVWALVGVPLVVRYLQERRELPMEEFQRTMGALQSPGPMPGGLGRRTAERRRLVSTLTYVPGLVLLAAGLLKSDTTMLAAGLSLMNLGTAHRLVAVVVDRTHPRRWPVPPPSGLSPTVFPFDPGIDEVAGDAHAWGDGWQVIGAEPRRVDDLVLVDADVS
jgi:hypothetical protein